VAAEASPPEEVPPPEEAAPPEATAVPPPEEPAAESRPRGRGPAPAGQVAPVPPPARTAGPLPHVDFVAVPPGIKVSAVGDSVMLGTAYLLTRYVPSVDVDAAVSRQASSFVALLRERVAANDLGPVVVLHIGNNGAFNAKELMEIMTVLGPERRVVFVNNRVPRSWQDSNNAVIAWGVANYSNARLADWHGLAAGYPELFWDEGVHVNQAGAALYVALVTQAIMAP
jgi:hypothetical protein